MAQQVKISSSLETFMINALIADQNLAITKAIIKLADSSECSNLAKKSPRLGMKFEDNEVRSNHTWLPQQLLYVYNFSSRH